MQSIPPLFAHLCCRRKQDRVVKKLITLAISTTSATHTRKQRHASPINLSPPWDYARASLAYIPTNTDAESYQESELSANKPRAVRSETKTRRNSGAASRKAKSRLSHVCCQKQVAEPRIPLGVAWLEIARKTILVSSCSAM